MAFIEIALGGTSSGSDLQSIVQIAQILFWVATASLGAVALLKFKHEREVHRQQKERDQEQRELEEQRNREDLNFRMHAEAQRHLEAVKTNPLIRSAFTMVDYKTSIHRVNGTEIEVTLDGLVSKHLNPDHTDHDQTDIYVRQCFDEMLTTLAEIANLIEANLVPGWVFQPSMDYYAKIVSGEGGQEVSTVVKSYANEFGMSRAIDLMHLLETSNVKQRT